MGNIYGENELEHLAESRLSCFSSLPADAVNNSFKQGTIKGQSVSINHACTLPHEKQHLSNTQKPQLLTVTALFLIVTRANNKNTTIPLPGSFPHFSNNASVNMWLSVDTCFL